MSSHTTVLKTEGVDALNIRPGYTYIDATLGAGGHTRAIVEKTNRTNAVIAIDADKTAIEAFEVVGRPQTETTLSLVHTNFKEITSVYTSQGELPPVGGILADLGWRMEQFQEGSGKGLSFMHDEPLHMTFGDPESYAFTAYDIVNDWKEADIANVIYGYGEERAARRIAKAIVKVREEAPITSSVQLADIVKTATPKFKTRSRVHPATKTFQALRIAVNDELTVLETFIDESFNLLADSGRLAIITFHSLEDRVVKHRFRSLAAGEAATVLTKKPIVPDTAELEHNPRARSAKLRILEKHEPNDTQSTYKT